MIPIFILTYRNLPYFLEWWPETRDELRDKEIDYQLFVVDNGRQGEYYQEHSECPEPGMFFSTTENIGCAGGWNLCADIGFDLRNFDKIVIGQEDAKFDAEMLENVYNSSSEDVLAGAYSSGFTFSLFGLDRSLWERLGRFDENLVFVTHEDCDYTHRCYREDILVKCLDYDPSLNSNVESGHPENRPHKVKNKKYMDEKWGDGWNYPVPKEMGMHKHFIEAYGERKEYPSVTEYRWIKDSMQEAELATYLQSLTDLLGYTQHPGEFIPALKFLLKCPLYNMIEIGSSGGLSMMVWAIVIAGRKISVDMLAGPYGGLDEISIEERNQMWKNHFGDAIIPIEGNSREEKTIEKVREVLNGEKVGFLFIDGDHRYEGVKADYENYKQFVSPNGIIAFHDINPHDQSEHDPNYQVEAERFWNELEGRKIEFSIPDSNMGIGMLLLGDWTDES
jgi:hypothetical protein